jgi:hypothetical protein
MQFEKLVFSRQGGMIGFERRCGASQNHGTTFLSSAIKSQVPGIVSWGCIGLFIAAVVFFIHHDESKIVDGTKRRGPSSNDDIGLVRKYRMP